MYEYRVFFKTIHPYIHPCLAVLCPCFAVSGGIPLMVPHTARHVEHNPRIKDTITYLDYETAC